MNAGLAIAKRSKPNVDPSTMAIGEIIYAANAIESLNGAIRESAKARGSFPTEEAAARRIFAGDNRSGRGQHADALDIIILSGDIQSGAMDDLMPV